MVALAKARMSEEDRGNMDRSAWQKSKITTSKRRVAFRLKEKNYLDSMKRIFFCEFSFSEFFCFCRYCLRHSLSIAIRTSLICEVSDSVNRS